MLNCRTQRIILSTALALLITGCRAEKFEPTQDFFGTWAMPVYAKSHKRKPCAPGSGLMLIGGASLLLDLGKDRPLRMERAKFYRTKDEFAAEATFGRSERVLVRYVFKIEDNRLSLKSFDGPLVEMYLGRKVRAFYLRNMKHMVRCA